ncbi:MAG TPA: GlsB/YeaQ/YmgE family stress response membrane protein [Polyangiaceae bacterium]|nr:GlsB/YeaQ/YmgE family stress response membrane protein [Polyangiaceae bacterium]
MSFLGWVVLGLIAGFVASKLADRAGEGVLPDVLLGIVGAVAFGFLFSLIVRAGVTGLNPWSLFVAMIGAMLALAAYHLLVVDHHQTWS